MEYFLNFCSFQLSNDISFHQISENLVCFYSHEFSVFSHLRSHWVLRMRFRPWIHSCCLVFCPKTGSLCLVYSRRESYLLNTNKARAHLHGGAPDSFQTENSYLVGIEPGISRTEVRVLTTELRRIHSIKIEMLQSLP